LIQTERVDYPTYVNHIGNSKYVLCPRGNGLETLRFHEAVLMGSIPIVEHSILDDLYSKTTSLIVNKFTDLNVQILYNPQDIKNMNFSKDILYMKYWLNEIKKYKPELFVEKMLQYKSYSTVS